MLRLLWEQAAIPRIARHYDVLYSCGNFAVFAARCPQAVTFQNPNHFGKQAREVGRRLATRPRRARLAVERLLARWSLKRADAVVSISQALSRTIAEETSRKVEVILSATPELPEAADVSRHRLPERYVLAVANDYPHKDWEGLINAFVENTDLPSLVIVGQPRSGARSRRFNRAERSGRVVIWGPESDRGQVRALYDAATAFIAHSFLEAAPLTPYEAVAAHVPVVLSDIPPHRECAPDAFFYDPDDEAGLAAAVRESVTTRRSLPGPQRRTWKDNAQELTAVLRQTIAKTTDVSRPRVAEKIVIDALAARYGGAAFAAVHVAHQLADDPDVGEVVLVARRGSLWPRECGVVPVCAAIELRDARRFELARRIAWEALALPYMARGRGTAVLTWSGMLPVAPRTPVVCYLANPLIFELPHGSHRVRRWAARRTAGWASQLLVPTEGMGALASAALRRRPEVVPLGIDHSRFTPNSSRGREVLCVADFYQHKRHDLALAAWARLPEPRPVLRFIGDDRVDPRHAAALAMQLDDHRRLGEIVVEGGLPLGEIAAYHRARVVVIPSEHESFSMPLLEAQACGVPAVVRDIAALRETGGDGTSYVEGDDPRDWAAAIDNLLRDDAVHDDARRAGIEHAAGYSWAATTAAIKESLG